MLKDEASLSREKMKKIIYYKLVNMLLKILNKIYSNQNKKLKLKLKFKKIIKSIFILGIENRIEQVIANLTR